MKKSVEVIVIFALLAIILGLSNGYNTLTGLQVLDLPEPPPPPGMTSDQKNVTPPPKLEFDMPISTSDANKLLNVSIPGGDTIAAINAKLDAIEQKLKALDLLPEWEERLNKIEAQAAIAAESSARLDSLQSQIDALRVDVDNLNSRPYFDEPMFTGQFSNIRTSVTKNTILSITLSLIALAIVIAMIVANIIQRKKEYEFDKKLVRQYLLNYQKSGYRLDTLRMHLLASGWTGWFVDEVLKEMPK